VDKQDSTGAQMQDEEHERPLKAFQSPDFFGKEVGAKKNVRMSGQADESIESASKKLDENRSVNSRPDKNCIESVTILSISACERES